MDVVDVASSEPCAADVLLLRNIMELWGDVGELMEDPLDVHESQPPRDIFPGDCRAAAVLPSPDAGMVTISHSFLRKPVRD